uniref:Uncharacterized protein n=1 Tax=Rhizophora mucronata TaxID=61149 RepID=A0A2P2NK75_RHIMU
MELCLCGLYWVWVKLHGILFFVVKLEWYVIVASLFLVLPWLGSVVSC